MVRLSGESSVEVESRLATVGQFASLNAIVESAIERADLDGHLALFVLTSGYHATGIAATPWSKAIATTLARDVVPAGPLRRTHDVAVVGVRLALGGEQARQTEFEASAQRECARQPMPPAVRVHDDERLLLGTSAGIGIAARGQAQHVHAIIRPREHSASLRLACLDLWAEALCDGTPKLSETFARRAYSLLTEHGSARPTVQREDLLAAYWLATRLLDATWSPTDIELSKTEALIADSRRALLTWLSVGEDLTPLDAAFALDALSATPVQRAGRLTALERVLSVVEAFPASAKILHARKRGRTPFEIADEYDVQDLFFALALPAIPDLVDEDPAGKMAGKSIRLDFTSQSTKLGFELKHVKSSNDVERVRREILIDEATYQKYPAIETVVVFVYDPGQHIALAARAPFEADLSKPITISGRTIQYITRVRG